MSKQNLLAMIVHDLTQLKELSEIQQALSDPESLSIDKKMSIIKTFIEICNRNAHILSNLDQNSEERAQLELTVPMDDDEDSINLYSKMIAEICHPDFINLMQAIMNNSSGEKIQKYIEICKKPHPILLTGESLLTVLIELNQHDNLHYLLQHLAKTYPNKLIDFLNLEFINSNSICQKPLHLAIRTRNIYSVKYLLEYGADPNQLGSGENQLHAPLYLSIELGLNEIAILLLSYGARLFTYYAIPHIFYAIYKNNPLILETLAQELQFRTEMAYYRHRNSLRVDAKDQSEMKILLDIASKVSGINFYQMKEKGLIHNEPSFDSPNFLTPDIIKKLQDDSCSFLQKDICEPIIARHAVNEPYASLTTFVKPSEYTKFPDDILSLICEYTYASFNANVNLSINHKPVCVNRNACLRQFHLHRDRVSLLSNRVANHDIQSALTTSSKSVDFKSSDESQLILNSTMAKIYLGYTELDNMLNLYQLAHTQTPKSAGLYFTVLMSSIAWLKHASAEVAKFKEKDFKKFMDETFQAMQQFISIQKNIYQEFCEWDYRHSPLNLWIQIQLLSFSAKVLQKLNDYPFLLKINEQRIQALISNAIHNLNGHIIQYYAYEFDKIGGLDSLSKYIDDLFGNIATSQSATIDVKLLGETVNNLNLLIIRHVGLALSPLSVKFYDDFRKEIEKYTHTTALPVASASAATSATMKMRENSMGK